ncbi:MAG TPA: 16S rRNA pseudouridine(516) synthase, partial [Piscinibacter sp.]|nr:16S rRNA pseudouridine(516) synthase [Piscinibacter sp.]
RLTLTEGKYHQVKRMVAAAGNRVEALHRSAFGALVLPADLAPGQWRWVEGPQALVPPQPPR